jgi:hypothetical protein
MKTEDYEKLSWLAHNSLLILYKQEWLTQKYNSNKSNYWKCSLKRDENRICFLGVKESHDCNNI